MRRHPDRPTTAVAAVRPRVAKSLLLALAMLALAAALAAFVFARTAAPRHAAAPSNAIVASTDAPSTSWVLSEPAPLAIAKTPKRPSQLAVSTEPDWSAFSLGVSNAEAAVVLPKTGSDNASPAELKVALSREERGRLIAAAREAESGVAPAGYRPAIGQLYPPSSGDGICR